MKLTTLLLVLLVLVQLVMSCPMNPNKKMLIIDQPLLLKKTQNG